MRLGVGVGGTEPKEKQREGKGEDTSERHRVGRSGGVW